MNRNASAARNGTARWRWATALAVPLLALMAAPAWPAEFVYEGRLEEFGLPAQGRYDIELTAFAAREAGMALAPATRFPAVEVVEGRFVLPFEAAANDAVWIALAVRAEGEPAYAALPERTKAVAAPLIAACWSSTGDTGSDPAVNFLGTIDAQPLVLRTGNAPSLRIEPSDVLSGGTPITANVIAGSSANQVSPGVRGATISGGGAPPGFNDPNFGPASPNRVTDHYGTVGGGFRNVAGNDEGTAQDGAFATVGGGRDNTASGIDSTVGGGRLNSADGQQGTVGGGSSNVASGINSTVCGGLANFALGVNSTIAGGTNNSALRLGSTVSGGLTNCAGGDFSWAGGRNAKVRRGDSDVTATGCGGTATSGDVNGDEGSFVWADSQTSNFVSSGPNQFLVRANGGMVVTGASGINDPLGNRLRVNGTLRVDTLGAAGSTTLCRNTSNQIATCSSSARYKDAIEDLQPGLDAVLRLRPVAYRWRDGGQADLGFVAEEVAAIDQRLIVRNAQGEIEGVKYERLSALLANAVQELAARDALTRQELAAQGKAIAELRVRLAAVPRR